MTSGDGIPGRGRGKGPVGGPYPQYILGCERDHVAMATTRLRTALLLSGTLALAGCASNTATVAPPVATAPPIPTATIGLSVAITAVPTPVARPRPTPTATRFVPPAGPWVLLMPNHGPPESGSITVVAGNLPPRSPVTVTWSPSSHGSPLTLDVYTGPRGNLRTPFSVPAAPPGVYRISIQSQGLTVRQTLYRVVSRAGLIAAAQPSARGDQITIRGRRFLARTRLLLVAYPLFRGARPVTIGTTRTDALGRFVLAAVTRQTVPGEYELRAYSVGTLAAQVADTFFQVSV